MLSTDEIKYIEEQQELFNMVINSLYLPNGYSGVVDKLDKINIRIGGKKTARHCSSCLMTLFKDLQRLYTKAKEQQLAEIKPTKRIKEIYV